MPTVEKDTLLQRTKKFKRFHEGGFVVNTFIVSFDISSKHDSDRKALDKKLVDGSASSKVLIEEELDAIVVKNSTLLSCKPTNTLYLFESEITSKK